MDIVKSEGAVFSKGDLLDAGYDMCNSGEDVWISPGSSAVVPVGVSVDIPDGLFGLLTHRSSLAWKKGCVLSLGVIDQNFKDPMFAKVFNMSKELQVIQRGERFCQLLLIPVMHVGVNEVPYLTERGKDGFGSSGS